MLELEGLTRRIGCLAASGALLCACGGQSGVSATPLAAPTAAPPPVLALPEAPASAAPAPPPAPPDADADEAQQRAAIERAEAVVRATPELKWLDEIRSGGTPLDSEASCDEAGCEVEIEVSGDEGVLFSFVVGRDGELRVVGADGSSVPHAEWSKTMETELAEIDATSAALAVRIAELPEIRRFFGRVRANGRRPALWLEAPPRPGCRSDEPDCRFVFYVGEIGEDHASRYATVWISRVHQRIFVADIARPELVPYEEWRRHPSE